MEIAFHTGLADRLGYACRLLRKAYKQQALVVVSGDAATLARLDTLLWTFEPLEFLPHARLRDGEVPGATLGPTPIWLVEPGAEPPSQEVLINLGPERFPGFSGFARIVELVGDDDDERRAGRRRWRDYEAEGIAIVHHRADAAA